MTKKQVEILKKAVGYPNFLRNYYAVNDTSPQYKDVQSLVEKGYMAKKSLPWMEGEFYMVSVDGIKELIELQE